MSLFNFKKKRNNYEPEEMGMFEKVSFAQFKEDFEKVVGTDVKEDILQKIYDDIQLPKRSTSGSAGYDFMVPFDVELYRGSNIIVPTGIKAYIDSDAFLALYPRSGMGFKYRVMLANTVGIIDSDYWMSDNEGHIMVKLTYDGMKNCYINSGVYDENKVVIRSYVNNDVVYQDSPLVLNQGDKFVQGIFIPYGKTEDDEATTKRNGGMGSTGK